MPGRHLLDLRIAPSRILGDGLARPIGDALGEDRQFLRCGEDRLGGCVLQDRPVQDSILANDARDVESERQSVPPVML